MDKFEYRTYNLRDDKEKTLKELGHEGWEVLFPLQNSPCYFLKRRIENDSSLSPTVNANGIDNEELYKTISRAAYAGVLKAFEQLEMQQAPQRRPTHSDYEYGR